MLSTRNSKSKKFDYRFEKMADGNTSMNLNMETRKVSGGIELIIEDLEDDGNKNNLTQKEGQITKLQHSINVIEDISDENTDNNKITQLNQMTSKRLDLNLKVKKTDKSWKNKKVEKTKSKKEWRSKKCLERASSEESQKARTEEMKELTVDNI